MAARRAANDDKRRGDGIKKRRAERGGGDGGGDDSGGGSGGDGGGQQASKRTRVEWTRERNGSGRDRGNDARACRRATPISSRRVLQATAEKCHLLAYIL